MKAATHFRRFRLTNQEISIHAAREGGDVQPVGQLLCFVGFQSTPPVKAATDSRAAVDAVIKISIHAAREGGDVTLADYKSALRISIHAAREGGDVQVEHIRLCGHDFNPRRP